MGNNFLHCTVSISAALCCLYMYHLNKEGVQIEGHQDSKILSHRLYMSPYQKGQILLHYISQGLWTCLRTDALLSRQCILQHPPDCSNQTDRVDTILFHCKKIALLGMGLFLICHYLVCNQLDLTEVAQMDQGKT